MLAGFIILRPVVRQNIIAGKMWQNKATHLMTARVIGRGQAQDITLKGMSPVTYFF
jgi:hypothetical protein